MRVAQKKGFVLVGDVDRVRDVSWIGSRQRRKLGLRVAQKKGSILVGGADSVREFLQLIAL